MKYRVIYCLLFFFLVSCGVTNSLSTSRICEQNVCLVSESGISSLQVEIKPPEKGTVGYVYSISSTLETFEKNIQIELPIPTSAGNKNLLVAFLRNGVWIAVPTTQSQDKKYMIGTTNHLSTWTLVEAAPSVACLASTTRACTTANMGECKQGIESCVDGTWSPCVSVAKSTPEICDGKDNNCDGAIDENLSKACPTGSTYTTSTCSNGTWSACNTSKVCNSGNTRACGVSNMGECKQGTETCNNNLWSGVCVGEIKPIPEICDGKDNNCDGAIDENLSKACPTGSTQTTSTCNNGTWSACNSSTTTEVCDGKDNDGNGLIDDGIVCLSCPAEFSTICNALCINLERDDSNCGKCGTICNTGQKCFGGKCQVVQQDKIECSNSWIDPLVDKNHCGKCNNACQNGNSCMNGKCICAPGWTLCNGQCVTTYIDKNHCGGCGNVCGTNKVCINKTCKELGAKCDNNITCGINEYCTRAEFDSICLDYSSFPCGAQDKHGYDAASEFCNGICIAVWGIFNETEGYCGKTCGPRTSLYSPANECGSCSIGIDSTKKCNNICTNVDKNVNHCGGCGKTCSSGSVCESGKCVICPVGKTICSTLLKAEDNLSHSSILHDERVCADLSNDLNHCGKCGSKCSSGQTCKQGKCS